MVRLDYLLIILKIHQKIEKKCKLCIIQTGCISDDTGGDIKLADCYGYDYKK